MLRVLDLTCCPNLKSILCIPSTLEELYIDCCTTLEKITFQSARFKLQKFVYKGCFKLSEIQGLFKLVPIAKLDESDLGNMKCIKAYKDYMADLVGDVITVGRIWKIHILYEYCIKSIFLPHIKDQSITISEYTSLSSFLSFCVPLCPKKGRIQGLDITVLYKSLGEVKDMWALFAKITNITKVLLGFTTLWSIANPELMKMLCG
ncbi:toll/interleukin-1 receptor (TIR) domain-containing protein [Artemisia annua]|uniref:Toll/interleukin-1 receptor (TIR) domain-containing protein n=1 Tax=Artemisia annua TaxID=35608 RepID=A0A2U1NZ73_ARTAN|nr:toll/interleukin-1 receptor (TIR) domain-containing protein [Artemisia annua]